MWGKAQVTVADPATPRGDDEGSNRDKSRGVAVIQMNNVHPASRARLPRPQPAPPPRLLPPPLTLRPRPQQPAPAP
eukprot:1404527-Rhodomonas_salina.1